MKVYETIESLLEAEFDNEGSIKEKNRIRIVYKHKRVKIVLDYYHCPACGVVEGRPYQRFKKDKNLSDYFCKICESLIHEGLGNLI